MNLYRVSPTVPFLDTVANFISENFGDKNSLYKLKVILPNGHACLSLQNILIQRHNITILPNIIPFSSLIAEGEEIFRIAPENLESISLLQEKILLAEIIHSYSGVNFSLKQSLQFCQEIAELFHVLSMHKISLESVEKIIASDHWQVIYQFLQYVYREWQEKLHAISKQDRANYQITMMQAEIKRIHRTGFNLIVAGILGDNPIVWDFLKDVAILPSGHLILPPIGNFSDSSLDNIMTVEEDGIFSLKQLLRVLDTKLSAVQYLGPRQTNYSVLNQLLVNDQSKNCSNNINIEYYELENIFLEAEKISHLCQRYKGKTVAIIVNSKKAKDYYCNFLTKSFLEFQDLCGKNLSDTTIASLLLSVIEILCNNFDIKKLFLLLKNPLIHSKLVDKLELLLSGKNRFIDNYHLMLDLIEQADDSELIKWGRVLVELLYDNNDDNFIPILKSTIRIAEKLYSDIWYEEAANELSDFLSELIKNYPDFSYQNKKDLPEILRSLISGRKYYGTSNGTSSIVVGRAEDLILHKFDLVILADFSEGTWLNKASFDHWINEQTLQKLDINSIKIKSSVYQYYFYLYLHNQNVIITRSKRQEDKSGLLQSNLLLKLEFVLGKKLITKNCKAVTTMPYNIKIDKLQVHSPLFPNILSITDIETLVRSPYSFYAKKILNLRSRNKVGEEPKISEFGSFVHKIFEQYSKNYNKSIVDKVQLMLDISENTLSTIILPLYTQKIWRIKLMPIAESFIAFDEMRRNHSKHVYSEQKGEMFLNIAGQEIKIVGVADRIEVDAQGQSVVIDYKTGSLPSRKDIDCGLSPQLIIAGLMMEEGGFGIKVRNVKQVIYVKISSSKPYIQTLNIDLNREQLRSHKQGLISLLEYYVTNKNFFYNINLQKYNSYTHLARILK